MSPTLYFGYGSNLWLHQMEQRCPTSTYEGMARLKDYRWMINSRGYANIVESSTPVSGSEQYENVAFGLVFALEAKDESRLDVNEGVPFAYTKEYLEVDFWASKDTEEVIDISKPSEKKKLLVYINRDLTEDDQPMSEYVYRMNMGIRDALKVGVPKAYVDKVMRRFIIEHDVKEVKQIAMKQALAFEDER
ncbi:hypothetical protein BDV97DRAFT_375727 [Delphinella strobiligena]|nr:hypothetical protein BDV97DRAFT_375727 [Delphinella strobiligena]